jgi:hypothetical protein
MELLLMLIELTSCPRLDATSPRMKVAFLDEIFVLSRAEASQETLCLRIVVLALWELLQEPDDPRLHHHH